MRLSWRWLSELLDLSGVSPEEGARLISLHTADVEGLVPLHPALQGIVAARVDKIEPHPNADRLRLCTVSYGAAAPIRVVCGAWNFSEGATVCFARAGAVLADGTKLEKRKIRGIDSEGMICAEDEMGLGTDHAGIVVLPEGTAVGTPVAEALGVADSAIEVNNTAITSRPDLWGHVGFARELSAILGRPFAPPAAPKAHRAFAAAAGTPFPVAIDDAFACRRYVGVVVEGVANGPSPAPVRRRLEAVGLRSVDLLVDLTNLVMSETGQPLHAFDLRELRGGVVRVRRATEGEAIETLDEKRRTLSAEDLVIADAERPLAIAGVMGGRGSGVRADTTAILLESACFDPGRVRRTAIRHGLRTDASARFEKSLDPEGAMKAAHRFVEVLLDHVPGAKVTRHVSDAYPRPPTAVAVDLPYELVSRRLGFPVDRETILRHLSALGFEVAPGAASVHVTVPSWRATKDVSIPEDLVEEVGRIHGYEHVVPAAPVAPVRPARLTAGRRLERDGRAVLSLDLGYVEIASYAFHGAEECRRMGIPEEDPRRLANPLSAEQDRMQVTCIQNLLRAAVRNRPAEPTLRLCEWTRVWPAEDGKPRPAGDRTEIPVVGLLVAEAAPAGKGQEGTFLAAKEDALAFLARIGLGGARAAPPGEAVPNARLGLLGAGGWVHPGRWAWLDSPGAAGRDAVGIVGEVHPDRVRLWGLEGRVAVAEIDLGEVVRLGLKDPPYRPVPKFPESSFDVAVIVPRRTPAADVQARIAGCAGSQGRQVRLFDAFEGAGIPEGHRSLAFTVTFGDDAKTLLAKDVDRLQNRVLSVLKQAGFTVRTAEPKG